MCSGMPPTEAACIEEDIKQFLELGSASDDDVLGMLQRSGCGSRSVGEVCLPTACPKQSHMSGSALELKLVSAGEVPVPICFESSARASKIRGQGRTRRRSSAEICLVDAFKQKCKGVRSLPVGTQDVHGEAIEFGKASPVMEDVSRGVGVFRAACQVEKARHDFLSFQSAGDVYMKTGATCKRPRWSAALPCGSAALPLARNERVITKKISVQVQGRRSHPAGLEERTYHFLTTVAPTASFGVVYEYSLKRYRRSSLGFTQLSGLIEMQRSSDIADSGCMKQELDGGIAPTASVCSAVDIIDVSDDDGYTCSGDVTLDRAIPPVLEGVVKQETDGRRSLPSDASLVLKAESKPEIKREPGERRVVSTGVSLATVSAAEVARPHAHTAFKVEADSSGGRGGSRQLAMAQFPDDSSMVDTRALQSVKREAPTSDLPAR